MRRLVELAAKYRQIYIYGFGVSGKWLSDILSQNGLPVAGFIDTDLKKTGFCYNGNKVYAPDFLYNKTESSGESKRHTLIVCTVVDIQDVWDSLLGSNFFDAIALGLYLEDFIPHLVGNSGPEYVRYSLDAVKASHTSFFKDGFRFVRSIDLQVTERCTMKCQDCSNLMQYYEKPLNVSTDKLISDLETFLTKVDLLFEIRLIGGEPFVHPSIYELLEKYTNNKNIQYVTIFTNSTIRLKESSLVESNVALEKLSFSITNYGGNNARNIAYNKDILDRLGIKYRIHEPEWWTDSGRVLEEAHTSEFAQKLFENCCGKNLLTVYDGKLFRCPFASNAHTLKAIPLDDANFVLLESSTQAIADYINGQKFIPACQYCKGRSWDSPIIDAAVQTRKPLNYVRKQ